MKEISEPAAKNGRKSKNADVSHHMKNGISDAHPVRKTQKETGAHDAPPQNPFKLCSYPYGCSKQYKWFVLPHLYVEPELVQVEVAEFESPVIGPVPVPPPPEPDDHVEQS